MANSTMSYFPLFMLMSMDSEERKVAGTPLALTMVGGPAEQRSAVAAVAVTTQVKEGRRRERAVASGVVAAAKQVAADREALDLAKLKAVPGLRSVATEALLKDIQSICASDPKDHLAHGRKIAGALLAAVQLAFEQEQPVTVEKLAKTYPVLDGVVDAELVSGINALRKSVLDAQAKGVAAVEAAAAQQPQG